VVPDHKLRVVPRGPPRPRLGRRRQRQEHSTSTCPHPPDRRPAAEWRPMYDETGRICEDNFWRAELRGIDWTGVLDRYRRPRPRHRHPRRPRRPPLGGARRTRPPRTPSHPRGGHGTANARGCSAAENLPVTRTAVGVSTAFRPRRGVNPPPPPPPPPPHPLFSFSDPQPRPRSPPRRRRTPRATRSSRSPGKPVDPR